MFVIDQTGKLVYDGAIDDHDKTNYVAVALDAVLKREPVAKAKTDGTSVEMGKISSTLKVMNDVEFTKAGRENDELLKMYDVFKNAKSPYEKQESYMKTLQRAHEMGRDIGDAPAHDLPHLHDHYHRSVVLEVNV